MNTLKSLFIILMILCVLGVYAQKKIEPIIKKDYYEAAIDDCSDIMKLSAGLSSDIQQIVAHFARGNSDGNSANLKSRVAGVQKGLAVLDKTLYNLSRNKVVAKKFAKEIKYMDELLVKTTKEFEKFAKMAASDKYDQKLPDYGDRLRDYFGIFKDMAQDIRKEVHQLENGN